MFHVLVTSRLLQSCDEIVYGVMSWFSRGLFLFTVVCSALTALTDGIGVSSCDAECCCAVFIFMS